MCRNAKEVDMPKFDTSRPNQDRQADIATVYRYRVRRAWRLVNFCFALIGLLLGSVVVAPQLLAFPYVATIGETRVYAERPIDRAAMTQVLARADARLAASPLFDAPVGTRVFLTDGGWRWRVLALTASDTVGFTRPMSDLVSDALILNRNDVARDRVSGSYGTRSLSGVIAHERTHIMVRRHLGLIDGILLPRWISEGYADHVAGESTLGAERVADLRVEGSDHPAIFYYDARRRVQAELARNGGDVEALLMRN
jgi:hypothetical protein